MTEPSPAQPPFTVRPQGIMIASTLCWLWGGLVGFTGLAVIVPATAVGGVLAAIPAAGLVLAGLTYCVAGYFVRRMRLVGAWIAVIAAVVVSVLQLLVRVRIGSIALLMNLAIIVLIVLNWRQFRELSSHVGA